MGRRNERSDPPPHRVRRVRSTAWSARIHSPQSPGPRIPRTKFSPQSSCNPSWGPPRGLLIPPARTPQLRPGSPLAAILPSTEAGLRTEHSRRLPSAVWDLSWAHLGPVLGPSWAVLGASGAVFRPSWAVLGLSWGPLRPSWGGLGGLFGCLGALEARKREEAKNFEKLTKIKKFGLFGPSPDASRSSLGASSAVLGRSSGPLRPSWSVGSSKT